MLHVVVVYSLLHASGGGIRLLLSTPSVHGFNNNIYLKSNVPMSNAYK